MGIVWTLGVLVLVALACGFGGYRTGYSRASEHFEAQAAAAKLQAEADRAALLASEAKLSQEAEVVREEIRVVYRDRIKEVQKIVQGNVVYRTSECRLDADGLRLWNDANRGPAAAAATPAESDGGVPAAPEAR